MGRKNILIGISLSLSLFLQGCYTQLAMFYPEPEIEEEEDVQFFETYSRAPGRPGLDFYAQDEGSMPLGYSMMQNRFSPFGGGYMGLLNPYGYNNSYYYGYGNGYNGGYNNTYGYSYNLGGYAMFIPVGDARGLRNFNKERTKSFGTNLNVTRSSRNSSSGNQNNSSYTNSSSVSSNRSSGSTSSSGSSTSSSSSSSGSSSGGRRATRRN